MKTVVVLVAGLASFLFGAEQKRKPKPPEVLVLEAAAHRTEGRILVDARVRNTGERPVLGLVLIFDFASGDRELVTSQKAAADEESVDPGQEAEIHGQMIDHARAVEFRIRAQDVEERELKVTRSGPYHVD